jgi:hypothetical protein
MTKPDTKAIAARLRILEGDDGQEFKTTAEMVAHDVCIKRAWAHAPTDIAALLGEVERLTEELGEARNLAGVLETELDETLADLLGEVERQQKGKDEARAFGEDAAAKHNALLDEQRVLRCAFCDEKYPDGTPATQHELLTAHVKICPKHPMRVVEAERDALLAQLEGDE